MSISVKRDTQRYHCKKWTAFHHEMSCSCKQRFVLWQGSSLCKFWFFSNEEKFNFRMSGMINDTEICSSSLVHERSRVLESQNSFFRVFRATQTKRSFLIRNGELIAHKWCDKKPAYLPTSKSAECAKPPARCRRWPPRKVRRIRTELCRKFPRFSGCSNSCF